MLLLGESGSFIKPHAATPSWQMLWQGRIVAGNPGTEAFHNDEAMSRCKQGQDFSASRARASSASLTNP